MFKSCWYIWILIFVIR